MHIKIETNQKFPYNYMTIHFFALVTPAIGPQFHCLTFENVNE